MARLQFIGIIKETIVTKVKTKTITTEVKKKAGDNDGRHQI